MIDYICLQIKPVSQFHKQNQVKSMVKAGYYEIVTYDTVGGSKHFRESK